MCCLPSGPGEKRVVGKEYIYAASELTFGGIKGRELRIPGQDLMKSQFDGSGE